MQAVRTLFLCVILRQITLNIIYMYTVDELKKELAYSYIEANPAIFQKQETPIPKVQETSGVIALLEQHKNKNS